MSINSIRFLLIALLLPLGVLAESGQYRSKVLLSPVGEVDKGAELSIEELEQQISTIEQAYAKSSAGRHLARHYVEQGDYAKALEFYQTALAAQGLSDIANREMLREVARVQLLQKDYGGAVKTLERVLGIDLVPEATDFLLLAQSHYKMGKYVGAVTALDQMREESVTLTVVQTRQALALYYRAGAYAQCEGLLRQLLKLEPENSENWHMLVSVYLQQNKPREALDRLALAREKSVPFSEKELLLLVDLQAVNENPYRAAEILSVALQGQEVDASGANYRKLFELWFSAREINKAQTALAHAAQLSGDTQLYLYLAQLQMDDQRWHAMHKTMLSACEEELEDRFVSRANLLLGVSQLKIGDAAGARRSFINATLIGGASERAGQWLDFMKAEPASRDEVRRIVGACYGAEDKRAAVALVPDVLPALEMGDSLEPSLVNPAKSGSNFSSKTVPAMRLYYSESNLSMVELASELKPIATRLGISLVRAQGTVDGPLQVILNRSEGAEDDLHIAFPVRGLPAARGRYKTRRTEDFKCVYLSFQGSVEMMEEAWNSLVLAAQKQGHELTGESRMLVNTGGMEAGALNVELQLGIR